MIAVDPVVIARGRQALLMSVLLPKIDQLIDEAAAARAPAPGLIELRQWAEYCLEENADAARRSLEA
jgi:hypothetical protein